jgi:lysine N6-hydroxylase
MSAPTPLGDHAAYDVVGIGLGPMNLGLAALSDPITDLRSVFLEARTEFSWHPGMMLPGARLQTPFMSDLVTMADPTSPHSFLNYLKQTGQLYPFYIKESFYPLRREFDDYCRWVAGRLGNVRLGRHVESVTLDDETGCYLVHVATTTGERETFAARALVLGTGSVPHLPEACADLPRELHSSTYLDRRDELLASRRVTVVGSGQSAAEIYHDLLAVADDHDYELVWVTRSPRFYPLEYTKLTLEMTSPEYVDYFHALPPDTRDSLIRSQAQLYKGISGDLVDEIFDLQYAQRVQGVRPPRQVTNTEVTAARLEDDRYRLELHHGELDRSWSLETDGLVLATGYRHEVPAFLAPVADRVKWDRYGRFDVARDYRIDVDGPPVFVQNAELHTHGLVSPDLGMAAYRNACILRGLLGREAYAVEQRIATQDFGVPQLRDLDDLPRRREAVDA